MKASGVEWLGQVPAHWEVTRLKRVVSSITVGIVVEPSKYYVDEGVPALRSLNVRPGRIRPDDLVFISDEANELHSKSKLNAGDIVAVRTGQPGTAAVVPSEFHGANCVDLIIIRKGHELCEQFLCWFLASDGALQQFAEGSGGAIQLHFNVSAANELVLAVPPLAEQQRIATELDRNVRMLDALVSESEAAITLLQERRAALISAAVTGKIDVRANAAPMQEANAA
ncbi:MAG: restriction endonuclease subunit S [Pseudomonadota bacterium]